MSTNKTPKKKVVVTTKQKKTVDPNTSDQKSKSNVKKTSGTKATSRRSKSTRQVKSAELLFKPIQLYLMFAGIVLIGLGIGLMSGGHMEDPNTWDENVIYGFRQITLAPLVILAGLVVEIYAIFRK